MQEAHRARAVALGYICKPCEVQTVLRGVELARAMMGGVKPGAVPKGFELFASTE